MSDRPQRTNTYTAEPVSDRYRECLFNWLAAHAPLWNQLTYRRRQQYFDEDGDVWDAEYTDLYEKYAPLLGKATCQQLARKNSEAWRSHFELLSQYRDESNQAVTDKPSPPGYWGNRDDGYDLHGLVRNDLYTFDWNENTSTVEFGVGDVLEDRYGFEHNEQVTLEVRGNPQWRGDDSRLELIFDEHADQFRVQHPVRIHQTTSDNSGRVHSLIHSIPGTRPNQQPSMSEQTTPSPSSLKTATPPSIMPDRSSNGSSRSPIVSQHFNHNFQTTSEQATVFVVSTTIGRGSVTTAGMQQ